ncbi:MAG: ABC transporter ATP-binding protein [Candidatus Omnitrophica bacterium]|nr:ABC transporter ATP-binding protein [Candidatus Omnitrophota bacterium]
MSDKTNLIEITGVRKEFGHLSLPWKSKKVPTKALDGIDALIKPGKCHVILGPNGAGKSTLLKTISSLILPDSGTIRVNGHTIGLEDEIVKGLIGFASMDERWFYWRLTGRQNLACFGALQGLSPDKINERISELFTCFEIDYADNRFDSYSTGMRKLFLIMRAIIHEPEYLLLDEPTKGLDQVSVKRIHEYIKNHTVAGRTVIMATHDIAEATLLGDEFIILNRGNIAAKGSLSDIREAAQMPEAHLYELFSSIIKNA